MARMNLSFLGLCLYLGLMASAMPTKREDQPANGDAMSPNAAAELAYESMKSATNFMGNFDQDMGSDQNNAGSSNGKGNEHKNNNNLPSMGNMGNTPSEEPQVPESLEEPSSTSKHHSSFADDAKEKAHQMAEEATKPSASPEPTVHVSMESSKPKSSSVPKPSSASHAAMSKPSVHKSANKPNSIPSASPSPSPTMANIPSFTTTPTPHGDKHKSSDDPLTKALGKIPILGNILTGGGIH